MLAHPLLYLSLNSGKRLHPIQNITRQEEEIKMAFYVHLGCELSGKIESTRMLDSWIHGTPLLKRLGIMETVLEL
jgi:hypothetical protein